MAAETLRAVVVGCGVGRNHADAYTHSDAAELVALCDIDEVPLNRVADANDVEARYTDFETMLREEQPDLINIATAQPLHAEMTVLAATQYTPKGILCEKGMANNMGEARAMLAACDRNGVKLAIGHESRYLTQIQEARELITGGAIGTVRLVHGWYDQGGMLNQMCHGCDRAMFILGDPEPQWVMGNIQRNSDVWERSWPCEEMALGVVGFADGSRLILEGETPGGAQVEQHRLTFVGDEGTLYVRTEGEVRPPGTVAEDPIGIRIQRGDGSVEDIEFHNDTYLAARHREIDAFARWAGGELDGHYQDAHFCVQTQEILMAIYESARTHGLVQLPMKTQSSPLVEMINSGALPVSNPGWHDIRHGMKIAPVDYGGGNS
jgi:predicted dehydrogenase